MRQIIKTIAIFLCFYGFSPIIVADPWFTGPLLAPAGHTVPKGHTNFEFYGLDVLTNGRYDDNGILQDTPLFKSFIMSPILTHGFTDWLDFQVNLPYVFNSTQGQHYNRLTDTSIAAGIQLFEQNGSNRKADIRFLLQQTFPTGKYENLNPLLQGTDSTGAGSYLTEIGLNFQYLRQVFDTHYLRTRLIVSHLFSSQVIVHGLSSYGGTPGTEGVIRPGGEDDIDLAFELTLNQNWVAVLEGTVAAGQATLFNGILDIGNIGGPEDIGKGSYNQKALAPALEYNFNANVGLIGGVWFPVGGKNTSHFNTYVLALNAYW